jgi:hypothetical protein
MTYQTEFEIFWEKVKESLQNGTFAKLTLAKTIGDTEIKNIFVRPLLTEQGFFFTITSRFKTEEIESILRTNETFDFLKIYMNNPFLTALLFTSQKDIVFKINKKRVGSITEQSPTFKNPSPVTLEIIEKRISIL